MTRLAAWLAAPRTQVRLNGVMIVIWFVSMPVAIAVPTLRTSILFVALVSLWANMATHLGAWIAALVNVRAENLEQKTAELVAIEHIAAMERRIMLALNCAPADGS